MSSTARGGERSVSDYYVTPIDKVVQFLREWAKDEPTLPSITKVLDPCAGGKIMESGLVTTPMSYPEGIKRANIFAATVDTIDIRGDSPAAIVRDYLAAHIEDKPGLIITNPPFCDAMAIIKKALIDVKDDGYVVMLVRLNYFGSEIRKGFFQGNMPQRCYVYSNRFAFTPSGKGTTDSIEYCHMIWKKGFHPNETHLRVI